MSTYNIDVLGDVVKEKIEAELLKTRDESFETRSQDHFHPSSIGQCPRKTVMERLKIKKPAYDYRLANVFETGHCIHEKLQKYLKDSGLLVKDEFALHSPEHNMSGHCDGIACIYVPNLGGIMAIIEIKSCSDKSFNWIVGEGTQWRPGHGADKKHQWQVQLYMYMTGCSYAVIIYENKNDQQIATFVIKRDNELIENVLLPRVDMINKCVENKVLPLRDNDHLPDLETNKLAFECQWCDLRSECEEEERRQKVKEDPAEIVDLIELAAKITLEEI